VPLDRRIDRDQPYLDGTLWIQAVARAPPGGAATDARSRQGIHPVYTDLAAVPHGLSFDAVVAINIPEHVYDIVKFFRSIAGILAPNGVILVSTTN
jgi:cyclopropane fatty-acyl-phospholipid synthase-like methyltransferase